MSARSALWLAFTVLLILQCESNKQKDKNSGNNVVIAIENEEEHRLPRPQIIEEEEGVVLVKDKGFRPPQCRENEKWYSCLPSCSLTCDNLHRTCNQDNSRCKSGCDCRSGYLRISRNGPCVPIEYCNESKCGTNEVWLGCGEAPRCDRSCDNRDSNCRNRGSSCPKGCYCKPGYARHPVTDRCVDVDRCPRKNKQCDRNEEYKTCGDRCKEQCDSDDRRCDSSCKSGCFCKYGYSRINGDCERSSKCSSSSFSCSGTDVLVNKKCEKLITCLNGKPSIQCGLCDRRDKRCNEDCEQVCRCNNGFVLSGGKCKCKNGFVNINGECKADKKCVGGTLKLEPLGCENNDCTKQICDCGTGKVNILGVCTTKYTCAYGTHAMVPALCSEDSCTGQKCECMGDFELSTSGQDCKCKTGLVLIKDKCELKLGCPSGITPILLPTGCTNNCQEQSCDCGDLEYLKADNKCGCPTTKLNIMGHCHDKLRCTYGYAEGTACDSSGLCASQRCVCSSADGFVPLEQDCVCALSTQLVINNVCVDKIVCLNGEAQANAAGTAQECTCNFGYEQAANKLSCSAIAATSCGVMEVIPSARPANEWSCIVPGTIDYLPVNATTSRVCFCVGDLVRLDESTCGTNSDCK